MEFWDFSLKIMKSGFYCTNLERINSRKLLNLLFKHISHIKDPTTAIIFPICFPMIFLDFLCLHAICDARNYKTQLSNFANKSLDMHSALFNAGGQRSQTGSTGCINQCVNHYLTNYLLINYRLMISNFSINWLAN